MYCGKTQKIIKIDLGHARAVSKSISEGESLPGSFGTPCNRAYEQILAELIPETIDEGTESKSRII